MIGARRPGRLALGQMTNPLATVCRRPHIVVLKARLEPWLLGEVVTHRTQRCPSCPDITTAQDTHEVLEDSHAAIGTGDHAPGRPRRVIRHQLPIQTVLCAPDIAQWWRRGWKRFAGLQVRYATGLIGGAALPAIDVRDLAGHIQEPVTRIDVVFDGAGWF